MGLKYEKQSLYGGVYVNYNLMKNVLDSLRFLVALNCRESKFKTHLETVINNVGATGAEVFMPLFKIFFDSEPFTGIRMIGNFEYNTEKPKDIRWNCTEEFNLDKLTKIKTKVKFSQGNL